MLPDRHLEDKKWEDTFESAHSVVLALFASQAPVTRELTPYYVGNLLAVSRGSTCAVEL